jgi:hypothetical protein
MRTRRFIWWLAIFSATTWSLIVGVVGYAFTLSPFPPMGGGVIKLIVLPICGVWVFFLGIGYVAARTQRENTIGEDARKTPSVRPHEVQQSQEKKN